MLPNFSIPKIRAFINQERIYMLMLCFILLLNAAILFVRWAPTMQQSSLNKKFSRISLSDQQPASELEYQEFTDSLALRSVSLLTVLMLAFGIFLDIRILMAKITHGKVLQPVGRHLRIKWGIRDIFRLAIIFVFLGYILKFIEVQLLTTSAEERSGLNFVPLLNTAILDLALLGFIIYFVKVKYGQGLATMGLKIKGSLRNISLAILGYIAFLPVLGLLLVLLIIVAALFNYHPPQQMLFKFFLQEQRIWFLFCSTAIVVVLGPIVEEVFFRGFAYNALKRKWGAPRAMLLTAAVFAGLHANLIGFLPIMALGLLLAYVYEKTSSLVPAITIHILHNAMMVGFLFVGRQLVSLG